MSLARSPCQAFVRAEYFGETQRRGKINPPHAIENYSRLLGATCMRERKARGCNFKVTRLGLSSR